MTAKECLEVWRQQDDETAVEFSLRKAWLRSVSPKKEPNYKKFPQFRGAV